MITCDGALAAAIVADEVICTLLTCARNDFYAYSGDFFDFIPEGSGREPQHRPNNGGRQLKSAERERSILVVSHDIATLSNARREGGLGKPTGALGGGL